QVADAGHAHELAAVEAALLPGAVFVGNRMILVGQQRERQVVLRGELRLALRVKHADAEHGRANLLEMGKIVLKVAGFLRAAWRVVLRIEIKHQRLAGVVLQAMILALLILQREGGSLLADIDERHQESSSVMTCAGRPRGQRGGYHDRGPYNNPR